MTRDEWWDVVPMIVACALLIGLRLYAYYVVGAR